MSQEETSKIKWTPALISLVIVNIIMLLVIIAALGALGYTFFLKTLNFIYA